MSSNSLNSVLTLLSVCIWATENAGVEKSGADRRGEKLRSRLAVWKAEPRLFSETALSYFLKIVLSL